MSVPVRPDYDHDVVISGALSVAEDAITHSMQTVQEPVVWGYIDEYGEVQKFKNPSAHKVAAYENFQILYTTKPAAQPAVQEPVEQEREILRAAQSEAVMPLIGPLLDAWEGGSDFLNEYPELDKQLRRIHRAMENATPSAAQR
jgi:hypothetical protein